MPVSRRRCRSGYRRSKVDRRKCVKSRSRRTASRSRSRSRKAASRKTASRKTASRKGASRRRCRSGYRRSKVDKRKCVRSRSKPKRKRCPKGSRRNKKTRKCEKKEDTDTDTNEGESNFVSAPPASAVSASGRTVGASAVVPPAPIGSSASTVVPPAPSASAVLRPRRALHPLAASWVNPSFSLSRSGSVSASDNLRYGSPRGSADSSASSSGVFSAQARGAEEATGIPFPA